jgi:hypothetical protein
VLAGLEYISVGWWVIVGWCDTDGCDVIDIDG